MTAADVCAWPLAFAFTATVEEWPLSDQRVLELALVGACAQFLIGMITHLYRRRFQPLSFEELGALGLTFGLSGVVVLIADRLLGAADAFGHRCVLATATAAVLGLTHRYLRRLRARYVMYHRLDDRRPVLVLGAGEGGYRAVKAMLASPLSPYRPVALLDDDPAKANTRILRVRVRGTSADLESAARHYGASAVVLAMPGATSETMRRLHHAAQRAGLDTLTLPPVQRLVGQGSTSEITTYSDEDVLRRRIVQIDPASVQSLVTGASVLVTGAGGSIGSELVRQLSWLSPQRLVLVDHDDSLLHAVVASIDTDRDRCRSALGDIRDLDRLHEIFAEHQPDVVFHAAALKHVPALEEFPAEGWKTNVLGTANVLAAAQKSGTARFVNISTDKAAAPANVLGLTKRIAERLTALAAEETGEAYVSVRFGNVIGSRGSVLETFERQIAAGGPVTVTHPGVTRYFMAVREAVRLTLQAAVIGAGGEVLVLDMGTPVRVLDVATQLVEQSGDRTIEIRFSGLRPGEKMHEVLLAPGETSVRKVHPMIDHVAVAPLDLVAAMDDEGPASTVAADPAAMARIASYGLDAVPSFGESVGHGIGEGGAHA